MILLELLIFESTSLVAWGRTAWLVLCVLCLVLLQLQPAAALALAPSRADLEDTQLHPTRLIEQNVATTERESMRAAVDASIQAFSVPYQALEFNPELKIDLHLAGQAGFPLWIPPGLHRYSATSYISSIIAARKANAGGDRDRLWEATLVTQSVEEDAKTRSWTTSRHDWALALGEEQSRGKLKSPTFRSEANFALGSIHAAISRRGNTAFKPLHLFRTQADDRVSNVGCFASGAGRHNIPLTDRSRPGHFYFTCLTVEEVARMSSSRRLDPEEVHAQVVAMISRQCDASLSERRQALVRALEEAKRGKTEDGWMIANKKEVQRRAQRELDDFDAQFRPDHHHSEQAFTSYLSIDAENCLNTGSCLFSDALGEDLCHVDMLVVDLVSIPYEVCIHCSDVLREAYFIQKYKEFILKTCRKVSQLDPKVLIRVSSFAKHSRAPRSGIVELTRLAEAVKIANEKTEAKDLAAVEEKEIPEHVNMQNVLLISQKPYQTYTRAPPRRDFQASAQSVASSASGSKPKNGPKKGF